MPSLRNVISPDQYGLGHNAGPTGAARHMAAEPAQYPGDIFAALDLTNAFGSVQWVTVLRAVIDRLPSMACLCANLLGACSVVIMFQDYVGTGLHCGHFGSSRRLDQGSSRFGHIQQILSFDSCPSAHLPSCCWYRHSCGVIDTARYARFRLI